MREQRSASQILFNFLPEQTADLRGRVWRVDKWLDPVVVPVDEASVRRRVLASMDPWRRNGNDAGNYADISAGASVEVVALNVDRGVHVVKFPSIWVCRACRRIARSTQSACKCGQRVWGQFHFVGFHRCGWVGEPQIPRCPAHDDVVVNSPGSSNVRDLAFTCPVCNRVLATGLGAGRPCPGCLQPGVSYNVHRAASVYTPHSFTMVNPPRPEQLRDLMIAGGAARCLDWVVSGMAEDHPTNAPQSRAVFVENLLAGGLPRPAAEAAADAAHANGFKFADDAASDSLGLPAERLNAAREDALDIALAVHNGRRRASRLAEEDTESPLSGLYADAYPRTIARVGLEDVELVDRFPVLRGVYGYTRGGGPADQNRLVTYRGAKGARRVYGDAAETEAFLFRLDPVAVSSWLYRLGLAPEPQTERTDARRSVLSAMDVPERGDDVPSPTVGSAVLTMMHSLSHRVVRQLSVLAGIDRESLAEYLVPRHLGFFIYAAPRGDFVLGGLQAVFETDLHTLLDRVLSAESRCPLDPGCAHGSGACLACLHLGEPSCTHFNRFLDRGTLFGDAGYLTGA